MWLLLPALAVIFACRREPLDVLYSRAEHVHRTGDLKTALVLAGRGLSRQPDSWAFRTLKAEILLDSGDVKPAMALVDVQSRPPSADLRARRLAALIRGRLRLGSLGQAGEVRPLVKEALEQAAGTPILAGRIHLVGGLVSRDFPEAERHVNEALRIGRQHNDLFLVAAASCDQGYHRFSRGRFDEALYWLEQARTIAEQNGFGLLLERTLGNLGWCYYNLGELDRAHDLYSRAEAMAVRLGDGDFQYRWLNNLGNLAFRKGDFAEAQRVYERAEALAKRAGHLGWRAILLSNIAEAALNRGDAAAAERFNQQAFQLKNKLGNARSLAHTRWNAAQILRAQGRTAEAENAFRATALFAQQAGEAVVVWKAHADLAGMLRASGRLKDAHAEYRAAIGTIYREWARITQSQYRVTFLDQLIRFYQDYVDFLVDQGSPEEALEASASARARVLAEHLGVMPGSTRGFQALARRARAVFLSYWLAPRRSFLWVVTGDRTAWFSLPPAPEIERAVEEHAAAIQKGRSLIDRETRLSEMLLGPARSFVPPGSKVVVIPDGRLHALNFETLVLNGRYWVEDVTVSVAPSLSVIEALAGRGRGPVLLIGDPAPSDAAYPALPHVKQEMAAVRSRFPQARSYTGELATPSAYFKARPGQFHFIHFAAHAEANTGRPLESAVILSGAGNTHKLYAKDVLTEPLSAELVTLSACRSAGGRAYSGEGLVGFAWAFLQAGARNVIAGLWDVDDAAAVEIMDRLYLQLARGTPPAAALRHAKLELLRSGGELAKPYYWAPFQVFTRSVE